MKNLTLLLFYLSPLLLVAQTDKGVTPAPSTVYRPSSTVHAVVIGISDYQDPQIPDLQYAHRDAEAFANFLRSPAGGSLDGDHLKVLINSEATAGNIAAAFFWLVDECREGDQAVIYFSGHGDVESKLIGQPGFLLCWDAPSRVYMAGGTVQLGMLQTVISTLSLDIKAKVVVIADACRSGKLAGSDTNGSQLTNTSLSQQYANETKILSCQPNEYSIEGEQWGGGRGAFSFNLVDALYGLADGNNDLSVSLKEVGRYLEDHVSDEVAPVPQNPMVVGNPTEQLAAVDAQLLADLRAGRTSQMQMLLPVEARGMEDEVLAGVDTTVQELYRLFKKALKDKVFLEPEGACADAYYERLIVEPKLARLHSTMTRNYAAALQDDAQQVINQLLATDPQVVDDAYSPVARYDHLPAHLARAAELLGERHYMWRLLKAREYFFRSKTLRPENHPGVPADTLIHRQIACLDTALAYDTVSAYLYFEKGRLQFRGYGLFPDDSCKSNLERAMALSPKWVLPHHFLGRAMILSGDIATAIGMFKEAVQLDSTFLPTYRALGEISAGRKQQTVWLEEYVRRMQEFEQKNPESVPLTYMNHFGSVLWLLGRNEEARAVLLKGVGLSPTFPHFYANLGVVYLDLGQYEEAERASLRHIELSPFNPEGYAQLLANRLYFSKRNLETVPGLCRRSIHMGYPTVVYDDLVFFYLQQGWIDSAFSVTLEWLGTEAVNPQALLRLGQIYLIQGKDAEAREQFLKLLENKLGFYEDCIPAWYYQIVARIQTGKPEDVRTFIVAESLRAEERSDVWFWAACAYAFSNRADEALEWLEKALRAGWKPPGPASCIYPTLFNHNFDSIRHTPKFKQLVKQYLPEQARVLGIE